MGRARFARWLPLASLLCAVPPDAESRLALLMRVHEKMRQTMAHFPNYTCSEVITRSQFSGTPLTCEFMDRLRLEVAVVGGREMFSWPGGAAFDRDDPSKIVGSGLIGTGDFAGFTRAVLVSDAVTYAAGEDEVHGGRPAVRYGYRVPRAKSGYTLQSGVDRAVVGYHGSIWVDPAAEQVLALEVQADDIPESLDMAEVKTLIEYKLVRMGEEEFPFPDHSELSVQHRQSSVVTRNRIEFNGCRRYSAESTVTFGEHSLPASGGAGASAPPVPALPAGLTLEVALDNPIDVDSAAGGDPISATLLRPVKSGTLLIPKGARLLGRMQWLEIHVDKQFTLAALDFSRVEFGGTRLEFRGRLNHFDRLAGLGGGGLASMKAVTARDLETASVREWKSPALFTMERQLRRLPAGFRMRWESAAASHPAPAPASGLVSCAGRCWENPKDGLRYVWVPPGAFQMGCSPGDSDCQENEKPAHPVTLREGFWLGQTEVTVAAFARFARANSRAMPPGAPFNPGWTDAKQPMVNVSWLDAEAYCLWAGGRLPAEAEWEWAARGGAVGARYGVLPDIAWFADTQPHPAGLKEPNRYGLYDMLGNASEWTDDHVEPYSMAAQPVFFQRPRRADYITRGGAYLSNPGNVRVSSRGSSGGAGSPAIGLRCIAGPPDAVARSVEGTRWRFQSMDTTVEFLPGGQVRLNTNSLGGHWKQEGSTVTFDSRGYSQSTQYDMTAGGETMQGVYRQIPANGPNDRPQAVQLSRMSELSAPRLPESLPAVAPPAKVEEVRRTIQAEIHLLEEPAAIPLRPPRPGMILLAPAVFAESLVKRGVPAYPLLAARARIQGVVRLHIEIGRDGNVSAVAVISGNPLLALAAAEAARKWAIRPVEIGGAVCEAYTEVEIGFTLK